MRAMRVDLLWVAWLLGFEGRGRPRRQIWRGVDRLLVDPQLEMKVGAGRVACRSLEPNGLALRDRLTDLDQRRREVAVKRVEAAGMSNHDVVAVTAAGDADQSHHPVVRCIDGRCEGLDEIDAGVEVWVSTIRGLER